MPDEVSTPIRCSSPKNDSNPSILLLRKQRKQVYLQLLEKLENALINLNLYKITRLQLTNQSKVIPKDILVKVHFTPSH